MGKPVRKKVFGAVGCVSFVLATAIGQASLAYWTHQPGNLSDIGKYTVDVVGIISLYCVGPLWILGTAISYPIAKAYLRSRNIVHLVTLSIVWLIGAVWSWFALGMLATG